LHTSLTVAQGDLTVEYMSPPNAETKHWCVLRGQEILSSDVALDVARRTAQLMAHDENCTAWLVLAGLEIPIPSLD
jgi:hypothetical protein